MLNEHYDFLEEFLPEIGRIKFSEDICCDDARDELLTEVISIIFDELNIPYNTTDGGVLFSELRKNIINDTTLTDLKKIKLISYMYGIE